MNDKKDPLYPQGLRDIHEIQEMQRPSEKEEQSLIHKFNDKLGEYIGSSGDNEKKKNIGVIITTLILLTLIISAYYFLIFEPAQEELKMLKTEKLNELHTLYSGALTTSPRALNLESEIENAGSADEVRLIDITTPATKDWKDYHKKSIAISQDKFNRTMAVYENSSKTVIMSIEEATKIVNSGDAYDLSEITFEKPNTVSVPVLISRLQAGAGLIGVGSIVDIYTNYNSTNETNNTNPEISGCKVLSIMRYEENGEIDSEYSKSHLKVKGNETVPNEKSTTFTSDVLELIKASMLKGYSEKETLNMLKSYGIRLSSYERQINLGDLDAEYMLLIETPQDKVSYILNNMDKIILTIPTSEAPTWMEGQLNT